MCDFHGFCSSVTFLFDQSIHVLIRPPDNSLRLLRGDLLEDSPSSQVSSEVLISEDDCEVRDSKHGGDDLGDRTGAVCGQESHVAADGSQLVGDDVGNDQDHCENDHTKDNVHFNSLCESLC